MDNYVNEIISLDKNRSLTLTLKLSLCSQIGDIIILTPLLSMRETFPGRKKEDGGGGGETCLKMSPYPLYSLSCNLNFKCSLLIVMMYGF